MAIRKERVIAFLYQKAIRVELKTLNLGLIGPTTKLQLTYNGKSPAAYTTLTGKENDTFRIVLGGGLVSQVAMLPTLFADKSALKPFVAPIKMAFKGLNYHEMGHVLFTDMTLSKICEYDPKYRGFVMQLFNTLEDPIIELNITKYVERTRPYDISPKKYINYIKKQIFAHQCEEYKDDGSIGAFMQYLLLALRCGRDSIKGSNAVYDKYSKDLVPMFKAVLSEPDATERQVKTVVLADWIIKNIKEFNWEELAEPDDLKPSEDGKPAGSPMKAGEGFPSDRLSRKKGGSTKSEEGSEERPSKTKDPKEEAKKDKEEGEAGSTEDEEEEPEDESGDGEGDTPPEEDSVPDIDEVFEDLLNSAYAHEFIVAKDEYTIPNEETLNSQLDELLSKSRDCVQNISKFLTLFKGRKKPRRTGGFMTGRLNVPAVMQDEARDGCEVKLFTRDVARGKAVDLAVSLVCDNSGSMGGTKSRLATIAALALAQACEWSKVPFECSCFTKDWDSYDGTSITIIEKTLDEPFNKAKPYFGINDSDLVRQLRSDRDIPTFRGNSEEVNLFYIGDSFAKCKHTTKLMFVFCDGATTGSKDSLKKVIRKLENDGIYVIGVGLMANEVAGIYPHHKIFRNYDEMQQGLAPYLVETLSQFATK